MRYRVIWIDDERDPEMIIPCVGLRWKLWVPAAFLNESRQCSDPVEVVWLRSYQEWLDWAINVWHNEDDKEYVNCFCLDHDLASFNKDGQEKTGVDVAFDITDELTISGRKMPYYECHSSNPAGKQNIESVLQSYYKIFYN